VFQRICQELADRWNTKEVGGSSTSPGMRIDWTRDEIVLACELVMDNGWKALDDSRPEVLLSNVAGRT
jgi:hypothetical protein